MDSEKENWVGYLKRFIKAYNTIPELSPLLKHVAPLIFQYSISDKLEWNFWLLFKSEGVILGMGKTNEKSIPILFHKTDYETLRRVLSGEIDPIAATMEGKYKVIGDMNKLTACTPLLPLNEKAHKLSQNIQGV